MLPHHLVATCNIGHLYHFQALVESVMKKPPPRGQWAEDPRVTCTIS